MWTPTSNSDELQHSRGPWKKHKYLKIDANGNYIYPNDAGAMDRHRVAKADAAAQAAQKKGRNRTEYYKNKTEAEIYKYDIPRAAEMDKEQKRKALNKRNLEAARNKAARKAGAKRIAGENAERARRSARLRDQRNAEGRLSARKQIAAGNQKSRDEAARLRKLNAINATRKAQKQGMAKTDATRRAADLATARKAVEAGRRNELNNRNLEAARKKAARKAGAKRIADENVRRSKAKARAGVYRGAVNKASEDSKRRSDNLRKWSKHPYADIRTRTKSEANDALGNTKKGRELFDKADRQMRSWYDQQRGASKSRSDYYKKRSGNKLPARLDVAAKQAGNAISREAYRTGYKARKTAKNAAKSVSSAAREAWNSASSYRNQFKDFKSFLRWYKNNRAK